MGLLNVVMTMSEYASGVNIQFRCRLGFVKYLLKAFFSHLLLLCKLSHSQQQTPDSLFEEEEGEGETHPSPAMVPFPVSVESITAAAIIKRQLSVDEYNRVAVRMKNEDDDNHDDEDPRCAVCLDNLEGSHEARELLNCRHVYHRHCLDAWVEKGHLTCPLCRAKLLAAEDHMEEEVVPRDPWRSERMMYLFGEDVLF